MSACSPSKPGETRTSAEKLRKSSVEPASEDDGERHLDDDEGRACAGTERGCAGPPALLSDRREIRARYVQRRHQPEDDRRRHGEQERTHERRPVEVNRRDPRQTGRLAVDDEPQNAPRERQPAHAANQTEQAVFDEHLHGEPAASRAERRAYGELARSADAPREQQVRHVHARDEQHERHRA